MQFLKRAKLLSAFRISHIYWVFTLFFTTSVFLTSCQSLEAPTDRRVISDGEYKEEMAITVKTPKPLAKRSYYWFKSQDIYASQNDYAGLLLNGPYTKYYYTNELAEKGNFKKGLKSGKWVSWYKTGIISEVSKWKKGRQTGGYILRDSIGNTLISGSYKNGKKDGYWIYPTEGDTLYFHKGKSIIIDSTFKTPTFLSKTFGFLKKNKKGNSTKNTNTKEKDSAKSGFFKRLFKKKDTVEQEVVGLKIKKLSQKERTKLVRSKEDSKAVNQQKEEITKKGKKSTKKQPEVIKKTRKITENKKKNTIKNKDKPPFLKRLFRKKEAKFNQNTLND